jgi:hypothetical protein
LKIDGGREEALNFIELSGVLSFFESGNIHVGLI